jgi:predicted metal-dependent peptidase
MAARKAGTMPGDAERAVKDVRESRTDWRNILKEFVDHTMPSDYSWLHPNRRFISQGIYLPGVEKENLGALLIAVDTSGSIDGALLNTFGSNIQAILSEARPEVVHVVYCDHRVQFTQEFTPDDTLALQPKGGGGTSFIPPFEWAKSKDLDVRAAIYLTDLEGDFPPDPGYPVLWTTPEYINHVPPFGSVVRLTMEGQA